MKLPVNLFGKLRAFPDFVESVRRKNVGADFRRWLFAAGANADAKFDWFRSYDVAWPVPGGKELVVGVVWRGADGLGRGGPFSLFCQLPIRKLKSGSIAEIPLSAAPIWRGLKDIATENDDRTWVDLTEEQTASLDIRERVKKARVDYGLEKNVLRSFEESLEAWPVTDLLEVLFTQAFWVHCPRFVWSFMNVLRDPAVSANTLLAMRLHAADQLPTEFQAAFWLRILELLSDDKPHAVPTLVLPSAGDTRQGLFVFFRAANTLDAEVVFGLEESHEYLPDLRRPEPPESDVLERERFLAFSNLLQDRLVPSMNAREFTRLPFHKLMAAARDLVTDTSL